MVRKLCKRIADSYLRHFITLIMIPLTFILSVVGIYGRVFFDSFPKPYYPAIINIIRYIDFFEEQMTISEEKYVDTVNFNMTAQRDTNKYTNKYKYKYLLILDRTMSNTQVANDTIFNKELIEENLREKKIIKNNPDSIKNLKTRELLILKIYENLFNGDYPIDSLYYTAYDGNNSFDTMKVVPVNKIKIFLSSKIKPGDFYTRKVGQKTDIMEIINKIHSVQDTNTIVTISDFLPDKEAKEITDSDIEKKLQGRNRAKQFNLIYMVPKNINQRTKSKLIVDRLINKIHGTESFIVKFESMYNLDYIGEGKTKKLNLDLDLIRCFSPIRDSLGKQIKFYYPYRRIRYEETICRIAFRGIFPDSLYYWQMNNPYVHENVEKFSYKIKNKNENEHSMVLNSRDWRSVKHGDTLTLKFPHTSVLPANPYCLSVIHDKKNVQHPVIFQEYIPGSVDSIALFMIRILIIFIDLLIVMLTKKHYDSINTYIDDENLKRQGHHASQPDRGYYSLSYLKRCNWVIFLITVLICAYFIQCWWTASPSKCLVIATIFIGIVAVIIQLANFFALRNYSKSIGVQIITWNEIWKKIKDFFMTNQIKYLKDFWNKLKDIITR